MSKKSYKSQASSSRAASGGFLAQNAGPPAFGSGGFGVTPSSPLSYVYEPPNLSGISEPNVVVSFKNLQKRDSTTKARALEDLQKYVSSLDPEYGVEEAMLEAWVSYFQSYR